MHHDSSKHGRHLDEAMRRETLGIIRGGVPGVRAEWLSEQGDGRGPDRPDRIGGLDEHAPGRAPGCPPGMTPREVTWRGELARALTPADFPADRKRLLARLARADAPDEIVARVAALPAGHELASLGDVARALGIHTEQRLA
jgi:hypothetical protein